MADRVVSIALIAKVSGFVAGIKTAEASVAKLNASIAASAKKQQALRELGNAAGAMGAAAAIGIFAVVRASANFEKSVSRIAATGDDAKKSLDALRQAAIDAGQATVFSATEAADAVTELEKAGIKAKDILGGGLLASLNLASAGELGVADAANIMATAMSQFHLPGTQASHVADLLAAAAGKAQGEVSDMALALKYVGPVAAQMGVSIDETTGTIAELAHQGILADQAGTSLRGMLTALTSPSSVAAKTMKSLGINVYDATGNFVGFQGIAGQLQKTMGGLSNAERDQALGRIFGNQQITAARILYAGGAADVAKWTKAVNDDGFAAETAATKLDNLSGDLEQLRGSLETAFITTGSGAQSPLRVMVQDLTNLVNLYNELPGPVKNGGLAIVGLTAIVGLSAFAASRAVLAYQNFNANLKTIGITAPTATKGMLALRGGMLALSVAAAELNTQTTDSDKSTLLSILSGAAAGTVVDPGLGTFIGAVGGALAGLAAQSGAVAQAQAELDSAMGGVVATLDAETGALTRASAAAAAKALADSGIFDAATLIGVSLADVTDAALGNADAYDRVKAAVDAASGSGIEYELAGKTVLGGIAASTGAIDGQRESLKQVAGATDDAGSAATGATGRVAGLAQGVKDAAAATKQWSADLEHLNAVLSDRSSLRDYEAAVDATRKALRENGDTLDIDTAKGRANQAAVDDQAATALAYADTLKTVGAQRKFLQGARDDLVRIAQGFDTGKLSAKEYVDQILDIPKIAKTQAQLDVERARAEALAYKAYVENLDPTMTITQRIVEQRLGVPRAAGGIIAGPGTGTSDSVLARLSNGEFVVNAKSTARNLPLLHAINAERFAGGGQAGAAHDLQRLIDRFHVGPKDSRSEVRSMVAELVAALRAVVGEGSPLVKHMKDVGDRLVEASGKFDQATQKLDGLQAQFKDIATSVASAFQHDAFGGSLSDSLLQLRADRNDARAARRDLAAAKRRGLSGPLLKQIAESGNTGLIDQLSHASRAEIAHFEALYRQRQRTTMGLGSDTSQSLYGRQIAHQTRVTQHLDRTITKLERVLTGLPDGVRKGAEVGTHSGNAQRQRSAAALRRAG